MDVQRIIRVKKNSFNFMHLFINTRDRKLTWFRRIVGIYVYEEINMRSKFLRTYDRLSAKYLDG